MKVISICFSTAETNSVIQSFIYSRKADRQAPQVIPTFGFRWAALAELENYTIRAHSFFLVTAE